MPHSIERYLNNNNKKEYHKYTKQSDIGHQVELHTHAADTRDLEAWS